MSLLGLVNGDVLDGVTTTRIERHHDDRGSFAEVFAKHRDAGIDPVQWSVVASEAGVLRGMHVHSGHDEYFALITGHATVGLHDLRRNSPSYGKAATYDFVESEPLQLIFPRGLVHGWLFHTPSIHLQATSRAHDHYHPHDNRGCHWSDPELGIAWPFAPSGVAERAEGFGSLADVRAAMFSRRTS
ncbi:MAG: dTDP-4-dehydrorhamnose 3,5-epimerase family protein [Actinomycetota bacterium]